MQKGNLLTLFINPEIALLQTQMNPRDVNNIKTWLPSPVVLFKKKKKFFFLNFWAVLCSMWGLSSLTRVEPKPPALEGQGLNHWTTRRSLLLFLSRMLVSDQLCPNGGKMAAKSGE